MREYVELEPEETEDGSCPDEGSYVADDERIVPTGWPRSGEVEFRGVTARYDPDGPDILTNINLRFKAGERVAVVGRTGSGKSTVIYQPNLPGKYSPTDIALNSWSRRCFASRILFPARFSTTASILQESPGRNYGRASRSSPKTQCCSMVR